MAKVRIAIPNTGKLHKLVSAAAMMSIKENCGHTVSLDLQSASPIDNCRNHVVSRFLESDDEYLLFMDSDNPPERNPLEVVGRDLDITVFPTLIFNSDLIEHNLKLGRVPIYWNVYQYNPDVEMWQDFKPTGGLQEIDAGGTGCMLIARRVLEKVKPAFYRTWHENGTVNQGSDLLFCKRAKDDGFRVWCDWERPCRHFKEVDLLDIYRCLMARDVSLALRPNINTPEYWDDQWSKRPPVWHAFWAEILGVVKQKASARNGGPLHVLDFGCGRGELLDEIAKIEGVKTYGVDLSSVAVDQCGSRGHVAWVGDHNDIDRWHSPPYDLIITTEVLEHIDDDANAIDRLRRSTPHLVYTVPHDCLPPGLEPEHRRVYTREYCRRITPENVTVHDLGDFLMVESIEP